MNTKDYDPAQAYGAKISLDTIAAMASLPVITEIFYVDANSGNDTTNGGKSFEDAFKTLSKAEDAATSNQYDLIVVAPSGTSGTSETAGITWDKNHITVLGATAPVSLSQRARIVTTTDSVDPCLTISGAGNRFLNVQLATYQASNDVLVSLTGGRNYFGNVHFAGIGHATAGDDTTARCLTITGVDENKFENCQFGLDTIARSVANALLEQTGTVARNEYINCKFMSYADNAGALSLIANTGNCNERWLLFKNCYFHNPDVVGSATTMTVHMDLAGAGNGTIILDACGQLGATDWADDFTAVHSINTPTVPTQATAGFMQVLA